MCVCVSGRAIGNGISVIKCSSGCVRSCLSQTQYSSNPSYPIILYKPHPSSYSQSVFVIIRVRAPFPTLWNPVLGIRSDSCQRFNMSLLWLDEILLCSLDRVPGRDWIKGALECVLEAEPIQTVALKVQKAIDSFKKDSKQYKHDFVEWLDIVNDHNLNWAQNIFRLICKGEREREVIIKCPLPEDICLQMCLSVLICDVNTKSSVPLNLHGHQCPPCSLLLLSEEWSHLHATDVHHHPESASFFRERMSMIVTQRLKHL